MFVVMIAIFLSPIYLIINYYLYRKILKWFHICNKFFKKKYFKYILLSTYFFFALSGVIGFILKPCKLKRIFMCIGNYWLGVLLYLFLTIIVFEILRIIFKKNGKLRNSKLYTSKGYFINGILCTVIIASICILGVINARIIHTTNYDIKINKKINNVSNMKIVMIADLHIGYNIGDKQISNMVKLINKEDADLVLIAGDIFDNSYEAIDNPDKIINDLKNIKSKNGVYAVYGNHDIDEKILFGFTFKYHAEKMSAKEMDDFLDKANITLLRDENVLLNDSVYLIGRADRTRPGRNISVRKTPSELTEDLDKSKPIIVLDHQPKEQDLLNEAGADLDLSGHTHDGQLFPGNITVNIMWDNAYGYKKYGNLHNIVTSGVGLYGPNMRIGTKAEIAVINVEFE